MQSWAQSDSGRAVQKLQTLRAQTANDLSCAYVLHVISGITIAVLRRYI